MVQLSGDSSLRIDIRFLEYMDLLHSSSSSRAGTDNTLYNTILYFIHQYNQIIPHETPLNTSRNRKAVVSVLWLQLGLVACYLPQGLVEALCTHSRQSSLFFFFLATYRDLHSSSNPILYCWKISEVRQAVKDTIKTKCCLRK